MRIASSIALALMLWLTASWGHAAEPAAPVPANPAPQDDQPGEARSDAGAAKTSTKPTAPVPLNPQKTVLLDQAGKKLILKGEVVLRQGLLEMLVCLKQTKEHESIVAVATEAKTVHAGLLALGCPVGTPVEFLPEYKAATGPVIDIFISYVDEAGRKQRVSGQSWVRHATRRYFVKPLSPLPEGLDFPKSDELKYDARHGEVLWYGPMNAEKRDELLALSKDQRWQEVITQLHDESRIRQMEAEWVFAGSSFVTDRVTGEQFYQAESGDLICVANFSTATIDLSIPSSATNDGLLFEAFTERIPAAETPVEIELIPRPPAPDKPADPAKPSDSTQSGSTKSP